MSQLLGIHVLTKAVLFCGGVIKAKPNVYIMNLPNHNCISDTFNAKHLHYHSNKFNDKKLNSTTKSHQPRRIIRLKITSSCKKAKN